MRWQECSTKMRENPQINVASHLSNLSYVDHHQCQQLLWKDNDQCEGKVQDKYVYSVSEQYIANHIIQVLHCCSFYTASMVWVHFLIPVTLN